MNRIFEALNFILGEALFSEYRNETHNKVRKCNDIVFDALTELKSIKESKPSEALKSLEFICKILNEKMIIDIKWLFKHDYNIIKQALLNKSKKEQGFDIFMQILTSDIEDKKLMPNALLKATEEQFGKDSKEVNIMKDLLKEKI